MLIHQPNPNSYEDHEVFPPCPNPGSNRSITPSVCLGRRSPSYAENLFGFESGQNPGPDPQNAARFLLTVFPPILMVISFAFSFFINFKETEKTPATLATVQTEG